MPHMGESGDSVDDAELTEAGPTELGEATSETEAHTAWSLSEDYDSLERRARWAPWIVGAAVVVAIIAIATAVVLVVKELKPEAVTADPTTTSSAPPTSTATPTPTTTTTTSNPTTTTAPPPPPATVTVTERPPATRSVSANDEADFAMAVVDQGYPCGPATINVGYTVCTMLDDRMSTGGVERFVVDTFDDQRDSANYYAALFGLYSATYLGPRHADKFGNI